MLQITIFHSGDNSRLRDKKIKCTVLISELFFSFGITFISLQITSIKGEKCLHLYAQIRF